LIGSLAHCARASARPRARARAREHACVRGPSLARMSRCQRLGGGLVLPRGSLLGREVGGESRKEDDDESLSDGSSANEYAEGLGCADRKRCRERASSGFEFHDVPREEYFEEPGADPRAVESEDEDDAGSSLPSRVAKRRALSVATGHALGNVLAELEALEGDEDRLGPRPKECAATRQQRLAAAARRCDRRRAARSATCSAAGASAAPPPQLLSATLGASAASGATAVAGRAGDRSILGDLVMAAGSVPELRSCCWELSALRACLDGGAIGAEAGRHAAERALVLLGQLATHRGMDAAVLKATGLGLELNLPSWRRLSDRRVARAAANLVARWRTAVRSERARREQEFGSAGGA